MTPSHSPLTEGRLPTTLLGRAARLTSRASHRTPSLQVYMFKLEPHDEVQMRTWIAAIAQEIEIVQAGR